MKTVHVCARWAFAIGILISTTAAQNAGAIRGTVTDPSGASIPSAVLTLNGAGGTKAVQTNAGGEYSFANVPAGKYNLQIAAKGFTTEERKDIEVNGSMTLNIQLSIATEAEVVNVEAESKTVTTDPSSNATSIVLGEKELEALSDDPDELSQQLQAMAGPGTGPNGGQIYIDGFSGGNLPSKASIREVRINSNPFSPEYDRPGFGRIEIFTKPGTDKIRGQAFFQYNNENFNSRSPLLTDSSLPPYMQRFFGLSLSGPLKTGKASFGFDFERRNIDENAFVMATRVDQSLNIQEVNEAVVTPQTRTNISPRLDYTINAQNTLTVRYQNTRLNMQNEGVGSYALPTKAYDQTETENTIQATETAILSPHAINETRFQFMRTNLAKTGDNSTPAISVQGAFEGGGAQVGDSGTINNRWELSNSTTLTHGTHTVKWGGRLRQSFLDDTSVYNFGGAYTFFAGLATPLDSTGQPTSLAPVQMLAINRYQGALILLQNGYSSAQVAALGYGASQFSMNAGTPTTSVRQFDVGLFATDDWRIRPNFTLSYGVRYETQTNIHDWKDWSPRVSIAWGLDGGANKTAKTVLRAGFGVFYDRISDTLTLNSLRYNGETQQSYLIQDPTFFPKVPSSDLLEAAKQPQQLQYIYSGIQAPRNYQASIGIDRQFNKYVRFGAQYVASRGQHLLISRNINAPINGVFPYGDEQVRILTESTGMSRTNQLIISPSVSYKKVFLFGFYGYSHGETNAEGNPADPYNLRAEWGPSSFADVRHRFILGTNVPMPFKLSIMPFIAANSGSPYNITSGVDTNGDSILAERPALLNLNSSACVGGSLIYKDGFGCFDTNPSSGESIIGRNYARGPANVTVNLRLARSWAFGSRGESGNNTDGPPPGMGGVRGGGPPPGGGPGGGGPPPGGGPGGGPGGPGGLFGGNSGKKYNITLSVMVRNVLNHPNYSAPSGDLASPFFGEYRSLAGFGPFGGNTTYNRKIDLQVRFTF